jgi:hypothetical protein
MSHAPEPGWNEDVANLHARDGHLTMLTMDRFERGELETRLHEAAMDHLDRCELCSSRFDEMHREAVQLLPPCAARSRSSWRWAAATAGLATAAALVLVILPEPQQASLIPAAEPTMTASSYTTSTSAAHESGALPSLDLRIFAGEHARQMLTSGDAVGMDEVLRLEVRVDEHGWLAIVVDSIEGPDAHPDYGAGDTGGLEHESSARMLLEPRAVAPADSPVRITHDVAAEDYVTEERIVAIFCPDPFVVDPSDAIDFDLAELSGLPEGCASQSIRYAPFGRIASS